MARHGYRVFLITIYIILSWRNILVQHFYIFTFMRNEVASSECFRRNEMIICVSANVNMKLTNLKVCRLIKANTEKVYM